MIFFKYFGMWGAVLWLNGVAVRVSVQTADCRLHTEQVRTWKWQVIESMAGALSNNVKKAGFKMKIKYLLAHIGQLMVENDYCRKGLSNEPHWTPRYAR